MQMSAAECPAGSAYGRAGCFALHRMPQLGGAIHLFWSTASIPTLAPLPHYGGRSPR